MPQKGAEPEELEQLKRDLEAKRAAKAARGLKVFYKVTVKVWQHGTSLLQASTCQQTCSCCACHLAYPQLAAGKRELLFSLVTCWTD